MSETWADVAAKCSHEGLRGLDDGVVCDRCNHWFPPSIIRRALLAERTLTTERDRYRDALEAVVKDHAPHIGSREGRPKRSTLGKHSLVTAFELLGWEDPHFIPLDQLAPSFREYFEALARTGETLSDPVTNTTTPGNVKSQRESRETT